MRIGYLECFSGISGDMLLGALVDAGVPFAVLEKAAAALNIGARIEMRKVMRGGLTGDEGRCSHSRPARRPRQLPSRHDHAPGAPSIPRPHAEWVGNDEPNQGSAHAADSHEVPSSGVLHHHPAHRHLSKILEIIRSASLADAVKDRSIRAFQLLGEAEAAIHSIPIERVHFHEVGALDTIVDIVCSAAGAESLGIDRWLASPLNVGSGTVVCQHGTLPVPAPAALALLADAPIYSAGEPMERVTSTGAAMLRMLNVHYEPLPPMRIKASGYGAGGRDNLPASPTCCACLVGETFPTSSPAANGPQSTPAINPDRPIAIIETVIDDSTPQLLAYVSELLLEAGAWDVYRAAVQMKKGRTGVQITVLASPDRAPALRELLFRETTTIGLRWRIENKLALGREFVNVSTAWGDVRIKVARWPSGEVANAAPEYEDCRAIARRHSVPLKEVMQAAIEAWANREKDGS